MHLLDTHPKALLNHVFISKRHSRKWTNIHMILSTMESGPIYSSKSTNILLLYILQSLLSFPQRSKALYTKIFAFLSHSVCNSLEAQERWRIRILPRYPATNKNPAGKGWNRGTPEISSNKSKSGKRME